MSLEKDILDWVQAGKDAIDGVRGSGLTGQIIEAAKPVIKEGVEAVKEVVEKDAQEIRERLDQEVSKLATTPEELSKTEAQNRADDEKRKSLDDNLKQLEAKFNEKHQDTDPVKRQDLQQQLEEKFEQLRVQLEAKLAAERQRMLEQQERDRTN